MEYYAHVSNDGLRYQTVAEHLKGTASLCRAFAAVFEAENTASWRALLMTWENAQKGFRIACCTMGRR